MTPPLPLFTAKLSLAEYLGLDAVNWSLLWQLAQQSPAHAWHEQQHPAPPSKLMDLGSLAHTAILEPGRFDERFVCLDTWLRETDAGRGAFAAFSTARLAADHSKRGDLATFDRQTREGKALWKAFDESNAGRALVSAEDHARLRGMIAAVQAHKTAAALLYSLGASEVTGAWQHESGAACKVRADRIAHAWGYLFDVDLKTTGDAASFERTAARLGYHGQAAMRLAAWRAIGEAGGQEYPRRFVHVVVETDPPHGVRVVEFDERALQTGAALFERAVRAWASCQAAGNWPAYPDGGPEPIELPKWALDAPTSSDDLEA